MARMMLLCTALIATLALAQADAAAPADGLLPASHPLAARAKARGLSYCNSYDFSSSTCLNRAGCRWCPGYWENCQYSFCSGTYVTRTGWWGIGVGCFFFLVIFLASMSHRRRWSYGGYNFYNSRWATRYAAPPMTTTTTTFTSAVPGATIPAQMPGGAGVVYAPAVQAHAVPVVATATAVPVMATATATAVPAY